ncbi:hypothetical protein UlMin_024436 [Ulmus minor]
MVCLLKKSLYGLKQSPKQWYKRFDSFITSVGFEISQYDSCLYHKRSGDKCALYLFLYVDDMLLISDSAEEIKSLKLKLSSEFDMKDIGKARRILGMKIIRNRISRVLTLKQSSYLEKVFSKFSMTDAKPTSVPIAGHFKFSAEQCPKTEEGKEDIINVLYSSAVGSIMYTMICTKLDVAYEISLLSRFMSNPGREH